MGILTLLLLVTQPLNLIAEDVVPKELETYTKNELIEKVYKYAKIHKNSPDKIIKTINCENREWDIKLQSRIINKRGNREDSWGLSQIHLPSHPDITKKQAQDPDFAINYMAEHLGRDVTWSCYKK